MSLLRVTGERAKQRGLGLPGLHFTHQLNRGTCLMSSETLDLVFQSLASRSRRRIIDILKQRPGASVNEVSRHFDTSRIAVMKHLAVLEEAHLITSEKVGRTRKLYFNAEPIQQICQRWSSEYGQLPVTEGRSLELDGELLEERRDRGPEHDRETAEVGAAVGDSRNADFIP